MSELLEYLGVTSIFFRSLRPVPAEVRKMDPKHMTTRFGILENAPSKQGLATIFEKFPPLAGTGIVSIDHSV